MNKLIRDLFYAAALGWLLGNALRILIERRQEKKARRR
jgi:hypothetical protein